MHESAVACPVAHVAATSPTHPGCPTCQPQEESSNQAHYRGRCLDGIEGRGRTLLLRDTRLRD